MLREKWTRATSLYCSTVAVPVLASRKAVECPRNTQPRCTSEWKGVYNPHPKVHMPCSGAGRGYVEDVVRVEVCGCACVLHLAVDAKMRTRHPCLCAIFANRRYAVQVQLLQSLCEIYSDDTVHDLLLAFGADTGNMTKLAQDEDTASNTAEGHLCQWVAY